jgi:serine protease DegQ
MTVRFPRIAPAFAVGLALAFAAPLATTPAFADATPILQNAMPSLAPILEKVTPAVVNVSVKTKVKEQVADNSQIPQEFRRFFQGPGADGDDEQQPQARPRPRERGSMGSGVIIDAKKGYIVTNHHVVDGGTEITVTLKDRREFTAKLVGSDEGTDVAVLQIEADNLTQLPVGDSGALRVGDYVLAVGNPFGLGQTVTSGIVSALGRSSLNIEGYEDFIQTDASINPGNSGGALVNLKGELVGINTAIIGPSGGNVGIGFAVPTSMSSSIMAQLVKYGEVKRGRLGVQIQDMTPELAKNLGVDHVMGAVIGKIEKDSPADKAGLKTGDVVVAVNDKPLIGSADLRNRIGLMTLGTDAQLTVLRNGAKKNVKVTVGKLEREVTMAAAVTERPTLEGATFSTVTLTDSKGKGVRITDVARNSPAWQIGLRTNDNIISVNRKPVKTIEELNEALKGSKRQAALFIKRGEEDLLVVV